MQTLKKLDHVNDAVAMTLDKLPAIRGDIVRTDPDWESWNFAQLSEAIRLWTRRNPVENKAKHDQENNMRNLETSCFRPTIDKKDNVVVFIVTINLTQLPTAQA